LGRGGKTMIALSVEDLSFAYGAKKALDHVSFNVEAGECTILLGPNGAGKSTLFSLITRLYDSREGKIALCGFDLKQNSRQALERLGVVFQQTTLDPDLSVSQNLRYHAALHGIGRKAADLRIQEELERLNMYERKDEKVRLLNGGHKRRVEIARALLHKPMILLLDEPTVGLDMPSRQAIVEHVHRLVKEQNLAVLWATHLIDEIADDDSLVLLHKGQIKAKGYINNVLQANDSKDIGHLFKQLTQGQIA
jgi:ABC-2 type transport system ATP-binding protein